MKTYEDNKEMLQEIGEFVDHLEEKYGKIDESQYLKSLICDFANNEVVAHKVFLEDDVRSIATEKTDLSHRRQEEVVAEAINVLNTNGGRDYLEDCRDDEWDTISSAVDKAIKSLTDQEVA